MYKEAFLALVRAGLWERDVQLLRFGELDFSRVACLAEEQSVVGLIAAGFEHVIDTKVEKKDVVQFIGQAIQLEKRNRAMNCFIQEIVDSMREAGIYTLLVKGQGIAQCYERPLWRSSGDVDFLLSLDNYQRGVDFLLPLSSHYRIGGEYSKEVGLTIDHWFVEVHGSLRSGLSSRVDKEIDAVQRDIFINGHVRVWRNGESDVFLPSIDNDVFLVFTHFIKHFYKKGIRIRQICDWCRLLWSFRDRIDSSLLERRLSRSGLIPEWKSFASLAIEYLGMPSIAMPIYDTRRRWSKKGKRILDYILQGSTGSVFIDTIKKTRVLPMKTVFYMPSIFLNVNRLKIKERLDR